MTQFQTFQSRIIGTFGFYNESTTFAAVLVSLFWYDLKPCVHTCYPFLWSLLHMGQSCLCCRCLCQSFSFLSTTQTSSFGFRLSQSWEIVKWFTWIPNPVFWHKHPNFLLIMQSIHLWSNRIQLRIKVFKFIKNIWITFCIWYLPRRSRFWDSNEQAQFGHIFIT